MTIELEHGDTGEALLKAVPVSAIAARQTGKVNGTDAWLPEGDEPIYGDVRHHRERIDQLKKWVTYWKAKADKAEAKVARARELALEWDAKADGQSDEYPREARVWAIDARELLTLLDGPACTCPLTPPAEWVTYGSAVEPGSRQEFDPECPEHRLPA